METNESTDLARLLQQAGGGRAKKRRWLRIAVPLAVLLFFALLATTLRKPEGPRFEEAPVERGDLDVTVTATGSIKGLNTVEVGAEVSGRLVEILAEPNDRVAKGDVLARIDPEQFVADVEQAEARLAAARASVLQARATRDEAALIWRRAKEQDAEGLISRQDVDAARAADARAEAALAAARAEARLAEANVSSARSRLEKTTIRAPMDGIVLARLVEPGQTVTAGFQTPVLFKLADDLARMRLHAKVDESDVGRVKEGHQASFTVDAWPDRVFESKVLSVRNEPLVESNVVSYETLLSVDNSELLLRPGMTATATIVVDRRSDALLVPNAALRFTPPRKGGFGPPPGGRRGGGPGADGPKSRVWVDGEGGPKPVPVRVLATDGVRSEVEAAGLEPGSRVIVDFAEAKG